jgi:hypothetical protein
MLDNVAKRQRHKSFTGLAKRFRVKGMLQIRTVALVNRPRQMHAHSTASASAPMRRLTRPGDPGRQRRNSVRQGRSNDPAAVHLIALFHDTAARDRIAVANG